MIQAQRTDQKHIKSVIEPHRSLPHYFILIYSLHLFQDNMATLMFSLIIIPVEQFSSQHDVIVLCQNIPNCLLRLGRMFWPN